MSLKIEHVLLSDYNFNVNKDPWDTDVEIPFNMNFEYGISYPEEVEQDTAVFLRFDINFKKGESEVFTATGIYQVMVNGANSDMLASPDFHIKVLQETYGKFVTLYNISTSQTPHKKAILSDDVLNKLILNINHETVKD